MNGRKFNHTYVMTKHVILLTFIINNISCLLAANETQQTGSFDEAIARLAAQFMSQPDMQYRPYVW